jgi:hypothetical protein
MAFYVPNASKYVKANASDDEDTSSSIQTGKADKTGFYTPSVSNYRKVFEQEEEERKQRERQEAAKRQSEQKKQDDEKKQQVAKNIVGGLTQLAKPISQGGANPLADLAQGTEQAFRTFSKQGYIGAANNAGVSPEAVENQAKFLDSQVKEGKISKEDAEARKAKNQTLAEVNKQSVQAAEQKTGVKQNQSEGALAAIESATSFGLGGVGKEVFRKASEAAAKRLGRDLTEDEAKNLAERTRTIVPEKNAEVPQATVKPEVTTPQTDPLDEILNPIAKPVETTAPTPEVPAGLDAPALENTLLTAAKTQAEQRLGRELNAQELDNLTAKTQRVVAERMPQIETPPLAGITPEPNTLTQVDPTVPNPELKPIGVPKPQGDTISGNAARIEQVALEKKLTDKMGDLPQYKSINMKEQAKEATDLISTNKQQAIDIIDGKANPPGNLKAQSVHQALEDIAVREGDADLLTKLAKSNVNTELSESAQNLRIAAERDPHSAVEQIRQIRDARRATAEKRSKTTVANEAKNVRQKVEAATPKATKQDWNSFVKELTC